MHIIQEIRKSFHDHITRSPTFAAFAFKTGVGDYAEHDQFIGVSMPNLRKIATAFSQIAISEIHYFLSSKINEERVFALLVLINRYQKSTKKDELYSFYMENLQYINNWNLIDLSAPLIVGHHLYDKKRDILFTLADSHHWWKRRIAIVSTLYFIRKNDLKYTFQIAELLLRDTHELLHKGTGWMLREAGKKEKEALLKFLNIYAAYMPRTMLRYAIEKLDRTEKAFYMKKTAITFE
ncbi:DNA alkylation repair enzyme [Candidatus Fokinia solitaria]|uniref:DNA alkylation repair enzyme n=1 Tax=Candidatus Fokinia solitaria TaxID=1802984 RepID=A0A2U8BRZ1_9RICK|nr:DNA alkylation repair protein [Candidatus Fokinia solitaria]AWD33108.1 DNA alkylation repair enzyme [Candidatus Fokinia solitaria]